MRAGFSLPELVLVLAIMGVMAALAAPRVEGLVAWIRVRGAASRLAGDLAYARQLAVRTGHRAVLRLEHGGCEGPRAGHAYSVVTRATGDSVRFDLRLDGGRVCVAMNGADTIAFNSRGLVANFQNRTLVVTHPGAAADTLSVSVVGRVLRRF